MLLEYVYAGTPNRYTLEEDDNTTMDGGKSQEELMEEELERQLEPQDYNNSDAVDPNAVQDEFYDDEVGTAQVEARCCGW
jgi:hypothetical protein